MQSLLIELSTTTNGKMEKDFAAVVTRIVHVGGLVLLLIVSTLHVHVDILCLHDRLLICTS